MARHRSRCLALRARRTKRFRGTRRCDVPTSRPTHRLSDRSGSAPSPSPQSADP
jgi:hypothetical protein